MQRIQSWCCLSRFTCIVISELDLLWCPSLIKGHTASSLTLDASKVNASSLRKSSLGDKWTGCEMWSSRVENKQIALLDTNVLSSLASNGGFWQQCSALTWGIQLQSGEENECDVSAFSCWKVQSRLVGLITLTYCVCSLLVQTRYTESRWELSHCHNLYRTHMCDLVQFSERYII